MLYLTYKIMWVMCMIKKQETMILSEYTGIYDLVVHKDNMLRKINELIDFSFVYDELLDKYCINNGRNAIDPIRMFKYLWSYVNILDTKSQTFLCCTSS